MLGKSSLLWLFSFYLLVLFQLESNSLQVTLFPVSSPAYPDSRAAGDPGLAQLTQQPWGALPSRHHHPVGLTVLFCFSK
jgi:hypothetical protein